MIALMMSLVTLAADVEFAEALADREASRSLVSYLSNVTIDSRPEPRRLGDVWEPWQGRIVRPLVPAIEHAAGVRSDYKGPRRFWLTLPRGSDKTGLQGRIVNWLLSYAGRRMRISGAAADRDQASLLRDSMLAEAVLNPWFGRHIRFNNYEAIGPGGRFEILSSDAPTASGRRDDVIVVDEPTYHKNRKLFDMLLSGMAKVPTSVLVVITNAGVRGTWQWEVKEQAVKDPAWHVYESPPGAKLASWMRQDDIDSDRNKMTLSHARRVFDNVWTSQTDNAILSSEMVAKCSRPARDVLWSGETIPRGYKSGPLYLGFDVGRSQDVSAVAVFERRPDGTVNLRVLRVMEKTPYDQQRSYVNKLMGRIGHRVVAGKVDQGGIGNQLAEELRKEHPVLRGVSCSSRWQGQAAVKVQLAFRREKAVIPDLPDLQLDLQQVEEAEVGAGGVSVIRTSRSDVGHADRFWACALALDAMPTERRASPVGAKVSESFLAGRRSRR
ncbi:MAG: hypothetical protein AAF532_13965 [Planctomycetota bacterium]